MCLYVNRPLGRNYQPRSSSEVKFFNCLFNFAIILPLSLFLSERSAIRFWSFKTLISLVIIIRSFQFLYMVQDVGAAPLLQVPNLVCYCYTTFCGYLVSVERFELSILRLKVECVTATPHAHIIFISFLTLYKYYIIIFYKNQKSIYGANDGSRTRNPRLGRTVL